MASSAQIEIAAVSRVIQHPDELPILLAEGIEERHFRDAQVQKAFSFIVEHKRTVGSVPHASTLKTHTGLEVTDPVEPIKYYAGELKERFCWYTERDAINLAQAELAEGNTATAILEAAVKEVTLERMRGDAIVGISDTAVRRLRYADIKAGKIGGISFPWLEFTAETLGLKANELMIIVARTGVGKTWYALQLASTAWLEGNKVLFISMEMHPNIIHARHDAIVSEVPFDNLWKGKLTPVQHARWESTMDALDGMDGFDVVGHNMAANNMQIRAAVELAEPDIVICDGAYLRTPMGFNPKMGRNEKLEALATEDKMMSAEYGVPWVNTVQFNREVKKKTTDVDAGSIYGSDAWGQNADYINALLQTKEDKADAVMRSAFIKHRNGNVFASRLQWDFEDMDFSLLEFEAGVTSISKKVSPIAKPTLTF